MTDTEPVMPYRGDRNDLAARLTWLKDQVQCTRPGRERVWPEFDDVIEDVRQICVHSDSWVQEATRLAALQRREVLTEYGQLMSDGGYHTRNPHPDIERIYPVKDWIKHGSRFGRRVFRRRLIVIEDWTEVTEP